MSTEDMVAPANLTSLCCRALAALLGQQSVALPGSAEYTEFLGSYFSAQQEAMQPACIALPRTTQDVSKTINCLTSQEFGRPLFAIRAGGHANWAGASNIAGGFVVDLRAINSVQISEDKSKVFVGAGAHWEDVYAKLDPLGLSVNGGRAAEVGVGGLTLGGGLSYFSPRYGWTCDTVVNFEIVLADASIVHANAESNPGLFYALKGGNNNFGVVTRIDLTTFEQGLLWSGSVFNPVSVVDDVISEFVKIGSPEAYDEDATFYTSFGFSQARGIPIIASNLEYAKPIAPPSIYQDFLALPNLMNTSELMNMTTLAKATRALQPAHPRILSRVSTFALTTEVLKATYAQWSATIPSISQVSNLVWAIVLEPLPPGIYARHANGNALGLADRTGSFVVVLLSAAWTDPSDDELVVDAANKLMAAINEQAKDLGDLDPFVYLNYAGQDQNPIGSYGATSVAQLQAIRNRVDTGGIFTNQVPGGFKIPPEATV
ncbi:hypothetical protein JX265_003529 [Neoarthrinium moseri]|uniref:FAD-binding PCMH-type domain-containing protein n=1 Tax=Neoarthrinium moseri TaxID=1658444 RepID=A0A9Q0AT43_9PEZI|nr:hypothetical protein JX265_003529 [Neoarthrinium moseri]